MAKGPIVAALGGDKEIRRLKKIYWGKPITTDVVSLGYPNPEPGEPAIEMLIDIQQAKRQADPWDWKTEILFLYIHGLLHVLGYDDNTPEKRKKMLGLGEKILWRTLKK